MSKTVKHFWVLFGEYGDFHGAFDSRKEARDVQVPGERIVKYIPAPVAPKAPKLKPLNGMSKDDARAWLDDLKAPKPAPKPVAVLTDWISCETPPMWVGVFEVDVPGKDGAADRWFSFWNGLRWGSRELSVGGALDNRISPALGPVIAYRGYTTPQE
jgi:hypothetical protein